MPTNQKTQERVDTKQINLDKYNADQLECMLPRYIRKDGQQYNLYFEKMEFTGLNICKYCKSKNTLAIFVTRGNNRNQAIKAMLLELINDENKI